jgi:tetratricopeptide (TPR) repeat protein
VLDSEAILQLRLEHAQRYFAAQDYATAIIELEETLDQAPDCFEAKFLVGQSYLMIQDSISAEVTFRNCLTNSLSEDFKDELFLALAIALFYQYRFEEALQYIKRSQQYNPQNPVLFKYKSVILDRLQYPQAAKTNNSKAHTLSKQQIPLARWTLSEEYTELYESLEQYRNSEAISDIIWSEFPEKPVQLSQLSLPPNQIMHYNSQRELHIFYGNLKFLSSNLKELEIFLDLEMSRLLSAK